MSIATYVTLDPSSLITILNKQDMAQYIFENGITQKCGETNVTISNYVMLGKYFINMLNQIDKPLYINIKNNDGRKIILRISDVTVTDMFSVDSINDNDIVNISFEDEYFNKIQLINSQHIQLRNKLTIMKLIFRTIIYYIIVFLRWISGIKN